MRKFMFLVAMATMLAACGKSEPDGESPSPGGALTGPERSSMSASSSDYQPTAAVEASCPAGAVLCADFESSDRLPEGWRVSNESTVVISSDQAYSGTHSLKVTGAGGGYSQNFLIHDITDVPELNEAMYGRMMIRLGSDNARSGDFTLIQADGPSRARSGAPEGTSVMYRGRVDGRHDHVMANYDTWSDDGSGQTAWLTDCWSHPEAMTPPPQEYLLPKNEWACVQWHFDANANSLRFWLNDNELSEITVVNTGDGCLDANTQNEVWWGPESFSTIRLGIEQYHDTSKPRVMYIDDIAIADEVVNCPG